MRHSRRARRGEDSAIPNAQSANGHATVLAQGVSSIASSGSNNVFALYTDGQLWAVNSAGVSSAYLDSGVSSIAGSGGPACFELADDGRLYTHYADNQGHCTYLGSGISSIAGSDSNNVFALYTDGISEAMNEADDCFGDGRLGSILEEHAHLSSEELRERVLREIAAFVGAAPQHDDMTLILLRIDRAHA